MRMAAQRTTPQLRVRTRSFRHQSDGRHAIDMFYGFAVSKAGFQAGASGALGAVAFVTQREWATAKRRIWAFRLSNQERGARRYRRIHHYRPIRQHSFK